MSNTSGGMGKKLDSARANRKSANAPQRDSPHESIQSYNRFTIIVGFDFHKVIYFIAIYTYTTQEKSHN
jgi:hypothetical protein